MNAESQTTRTRNSTATRTRILESARAKFARDNYDNVGIRDIAASAGVDSALICRYFGSKEELFATVLGSAESKMDLFEAGREGLARRAAEMLLDNAKKDSKILDLMIMLNSASSATAGDMVRASIKERFHDPVAELIGGPHAELRAQLFGTTCLGLAVSRTLNGDDRLSAVPREALIERIAAMLEDSLKPF